MGLTLDGISKSYGPLEVLRPVNLEIPDGEFLTVLGPSGSGKTTILRLVGGFIQPTHGRILLDGRDLSHVPTNKRPFNTVFQDYALFPHMTVAANVGYGLMIRRKAPAEIKRIVTDALDIVGLGAFPARYPAELSGGQRQRVALARAIVCEPRIVLLDEPLSALDAELRRQMRGFLKDLQRKIGTTFLFVTHDQEEAITMSDRLVVMNVGGIEQVGTPKDIYYAPRTPFVAGFFGENNLFDGRVADGVLNTPFGPVPLPAGTPAEAGPVLLAMRPERISPTAREGGLNILGRIADLTFGGSASFLILVTDAVPTQPLLVRLSSERYPTGLEPGAALTVSIDPADIAIVRTGA
jgi:ABC-type Fe3+/spermidine/putrescine transport system ATPase subunit